MSAAPARTDALPRTLGLWSAITIVVGITIGSGIFRSPAGIANRLPGPGAMLAVWVVGGILAMCGALSLAEVASTYPKTGGIYVFLREGWGQLAAFLFGWAELVIIRAAAIGAISITFAEYFMRVLGFEPSVAPAVHPKFKTPVNAIVLAALLGVAFVLLRRYEDLADAFVTAILPFYVLGVAAIFVLRRRPGYAPAFRCPGYPVVPILFILATLYLLVNAVVDATTRWPTIAVLGVILVGIPVYCATVGRRHAPPDGARTAAGETA